MANKKTTRTRYTDEQKQSALAIIERTEESVSTVAKKLNIPQKTLSNWTKNETIEAHCDKGTDPKTIQELAMMGLKKIENVNIFSDAYLKRLSEVAEIGVAKMEELILKSYEPHHLAMVTKATEVIKEMATDIKQSKEDRGNQGTSPSYSQIMLHFYNHNGKPPVPTFDNDGNITN